MVSQLQNRVVVDREGAGPLYIDRSLLGDAVAIVGAVVAVPPPPPPPQNCRAPAGNPTPHLSTNPPFIQNHNTTTPRWPSP